LPILDSDTSEVTADSVKLEDAEKVDEDRAERQPVAIAFVVGVDDARIAKGVLLVRHGKKWVRQSEAHVFDNHGCASTKS